MPASDNVHGEGILHSICHVLDVVLEKVIVPLGMGALAIVVFFQVLNRFILHIPAPWTEEIARYIFVWTALLGAASGVRRGIHLNVELLQNAVGERFARILVVLSHLLTLFFLGVLVHQGFKWATGNGFRVIADSMRVPMFYFQVIVPISAILMFLFTVEQALEIRRRHKTQQGGK
jgi:TRAP-type C4-dicarboxylate transport system permease small subunit